MELTEFNNNNTSMLPVPEPIRSAKYSLPLIPENSLKRLEKNILQ